MDTDRLATGMLHAPLAELERALTETFMLARGLDADALAGLPEPERAALLREVSLTVSSKLAEIEARSQFVHDLHS